MDPLRSPDLIADEPVRTPRLVLRPQPRPAAAERGAGPPMLWDVLDRTSGAALGSVQLGAPDAHADGTLECRLAPRARGLGLAAEAVGGVSRRLFERGDERLEIRALLADPATARLALRAGFCFEAVRRQARMPSGQRETLAVFARVPGDPGDPIPPSFAPLPPAGLTDATITLRSMLPADLAGFAEQEADPLTLAVGFTGRAPTPESMRRMLAGSRLDWLVGRAAGLSVIDRRTGRFAGAVRLRITGPPGVAGIGYAMHPDFRGRGYTTRALRLLGAWAFGAGGLARLELGAKVDNVASQRAALAAGFRPEGVLRARLRNVDGSFSDEARFALLRPAQADSAPPSLINP